MMSVAATCALNGFAGQRIFAAGAIQSQPFVSPEHGQIMEAIFRGDAAEASRVMRAHVTLLGEGLSDLLHFLRMSGNIDFGVELA